MLGPAHPPHAPALILHGFPPPYGSLTEEGVWGARTDSCSPTKEKP